MEFWITIPEGKIFGEEPQALSAKIHYNLEEEKVLVGEDCLENFWDLLQDKLEPIHFVIDSGNSNNNEFLNFVAQWFNEDETTKQTLDNEVRIIDTSLFGSFILVQDSGYSELRVDNFFGLLQLNEWFIKFKLEQK